MCAKKCYDAIINFIVFNEGLKFMSSILIIVMASVRIRARCKMLFKCVKSSIGLLLTLRCACDVLVVESLKEIFELNFK